MIHSPVPSCRSPQPPLELCHSDHSSNTPSFTPSPPLTYFSASPESDQFSRRAFYNQCIAPGRGVDIHRPQATLIARGLFLSDAYSAMDPTVLQLIDPSHVLSVMPPPWHDYGPAVQTKRIAIDDTEYTDLLPDLKDAVSWIADARHAGGTVLVHCAWGKSRSASVVLAYLVAHAGMTLDGALAYVQARRPLVEPNTGFMRQLRQYEESWLHDIAE
ncbi:phosphatases II [Artomyces pyxidatus]|uniref:Phosphatases II n=1 Tax=Artomyces pyxidatus TaxID=48021 RepID=A0ACB8SPU1_9AGAM|nr:phosphatases II [Artomyces pyxidatus]